MKYLLYMPHSCIQLYNFLPPNYSCKRDIWKESELLGNRDVDLECLVCSYWWLSLLHKWAKISSKMGWILSEQNHLNSECIQFPFWPISNSQLATHIGVKMIIMLIFVLTSTYIFTNLQSPTLANFNCLGGAKVSRIGSNFGRWLELKAR